MRTFSLLLPAMGNALAPDTTVWIDVLLAHTTLSLRDLARVALTNKEVAEQVNVLVDTFSKPVLVTMLARLPVVKSTELKDLRLFHTTVGTVCELGALCYTFPPWWSYKTARMRSIIEPEAYHPYEQNADCILSGTVLFHPSSLYTDKVNPYIMYCQVYPILDVGIRECCKRLKQAESIT